MLDSDPVSDGTVNAVRSEDGGEVGMVTNGRGRSGVGNIESCGGLIRKL